MQVGVAEPGAAHLEQDLARAGLGPRDRPQLRRPLPLDELNGLHGRATHGRTAPQRLSTAHALTPGAP